VTYAIEDTLGSLFSEAAFETLDDTDEVLGVITRDDEAELDVEEAILSL
jgi:hypothetical protein